MPEGGQITDSLPDNSLITDLLPIRFREGYWLRQFAPTFHYRDNPVAELPRFEYFRVNAVWLSGDVTTTAASLSQLLSPSRRRWKFAFLQSRRGRSASLRRT